MRFDSALLGRTRPLLSVTQYGPRWPEDNPIQITFYADRKRARKFGTPVAPERGKGAPAHLDDQEARSAFRRPCRFAQLRRCCQSGLAQSKWALMLLPHLHCSQTTAKTCSQTFPSTQRASGCHYSWIARARRHAHLLRHY